MDYALITGASSGIGKALAMELAARGYHLALVSKSLDSLQALKAQVEEAYPVKAKILAVDMVRETSADEITDWLQNEKIKISVLINNAAKAKWGKIDSISYEEQMDMIKLNLISLFSLCHKLLPDLKKNGNSHILNVTGIGAFQPVPYFGIYAASKSFVLSFSRALRYELSGTGINVSCLCHGPADTGFFAKSGFDKSGISNSKTIKMDPDDIAKIAIEGLFDRNALIVPGFSNKMGLFFSKCLPTGWMVKLGGYLFKPSKSPFQE